jgi:hypothetical protein
MDTEIIIEALNDRIEKLQHNVESFGKNPNNYTIELADTIKVLKKITSFQNRRVPHLIFLPEAQL